MNISFSKLNHELIQKFVCPNSGILPQGMFLYYWNNYYVPTLMAKIKSEQKVKEYLSIYHKTGYVINDHSEHWQRTTEEGRCFLHYIDRFDRNHIATFEEWLEMRSNKTLYEERLKSLQDVLKDLPSDIQVNVTAFSSQW